MRGTARSLRNRKPRALPKDKRDSPAIQRLISVATDRRLPSKYCLDGRPNRQMFRLSAWIEKVVPSQSVGISLAERIFKKIYGLRRGKLHLPRGSPAELSYLTKLTTGQLRESVYAIDANHSERYRINGPVSDFVHRVIPGGHIRTVNGDISVHIRQSNSVKPMLESHMPRLGTKRVWPSSPTLNEVLSMSRRGITTTGLRTRCTPVKHRIHLSQYNSDIVMRARVISHQVMGIRSDIKVPEDYLRYFRYRENFLILWCRHNLPNGLVRFLTGQWIRNPHNLWLREKSSFKTFLKTTPHTAFGCGQPGPW